MEESYREKRVENQLVKMKTKYMRCNFSGLESIKEQPIKIGKELVVMCYKFKQRGATVKPNEALLLLLFFFERSLH